MCPLYCMCAYTCVRTVCTAFSVSVYPWLTLLFLLSLAFLLPVELFKVTETVVLLHLPPLYWWTHHSPGNHSRTFTQQYPGNQVPSSLLYCSPLTLHVGTQTHMHTLLMHSFVFSSTGSFWGWRDDCCTLLASKLNCTEVNQAVYTWLSNHSLPQNILFIKH